MDKEDLLRLRMAARVQQKCTALEFRVTNLARVRIQFSGKVERKKWLYCFQESRTQGLRINNMADSACTAHKDLRTWLCYQTAWRVTSSLQ